MQELRWRYPEAQFSGFGGPHMQQAGLDCLFQLTDLAVMGIGGVVPLLRKFISLGKQGGAYLKEHRPDAVVLVDFPGFNWWIAKAAKREGIPVFYYCPPQLWAWASWRISKVRRYIDCILSVLPFEAEWYRSRGIDVEYVGHPFFDEVAAHRLDGECCDRMTSAGGPVVAILPGSRKAEVNRNFPAMLATMQKIYQQHPEVRFPVACYRKWHYERCRELITGEHRRLPIDLYVGRTSEVIESADCALMVSGSISLELLARRTPAVVQYRGTWLMYFLAKALLHVKYMSLPNLMVQKPLMPEFPFVGQIDLNASKMAGIINNWLSHPAELAAVRDEMNRLADEVAVTGGVSRAADALIRRLDFPAASRRAA
jgi:lipid-A-disaccharide synthase